MPPYIREYVFENVGLDDRTQSVCVSTGRLPSASYSAPARPPPTMGKCGTRDAEAMKLAMCEDLRTAGISHLREDHDEMEKTSVPAATAVRRPDAGGDDDDDTRTLKPPCRVHHQEATGRGADERQGNRTLLVNVNPRLNADNELCSIGEVSSKDTSSHNGSTEHLLEDPSQSPPVKDSFQLLAKEELYDSKKPRFFPDNLELSPTNNVLAQIADGGLLNSPTSSTSPVDDVSVIVGPNNRLSTVLENIPLLYIPKTKQLVSHQWSGLIKDNGFVESINQFSNINSSLSDVRYVPMTEKLQFEDEIISIKDDLELDSPVSTLPRTNTSDSLIRTDVSSLSSISTDITGSVASVSDDYHDGRGAVPEGLEAGFIEINLHSRNSYERTKIHSRYCVMDGKEDKSKRKSLGLSGFLAKKHRDHEESEPGWKLFGRVPPKETTHKNPSQISEEYQAKHRTAQLTTARRARKDIEVMSTTALILENRPGNLPSKAPEEERKHKQEYEAMVEAAKKREQRELKQKKKDLQQQLRHEEQLVAAARCWNSDILPSWDVMKSSKKARDLWWQGLPPSVRGKVWKLAIGNELNITSELYDICLNRAKDKIKALNESVDSHQLSDASEHSSSKEASVELIKLDVSRTFPQLCIFQKGGPYHDLLHSLLGAYACYRPDVGYVQGMSFLAAVLLLNMDVADAFICFANLLNGPCQVAFFRVDEEMMKSYFNTYEEFLEENMAELYQHFENQSFTPDIYIIDWIFTLYSKSLPLDVACRVWDVFCRDGEEFLFRTALGILRLYEDILLKMDFIHLAEFLTKLPEDISSEQLFQNVQTVRMIKDKKKFAQVLMGQRDAKDLSKSDYFS